ncbi:efflux RND transporter periplasmic adaptor subunit [bacterium]|nr:efflux RND transporter periplasmic adaptor subunit [bacterium]
MNTKQVLAFACVLTLGAGVAVTHFGVKPSTRQSEGKNGEGANELPKGSHGGRLLTEGNFSVEMTIFERGVPPEFRVFLTENGRELPPTAVALTVKLYRLGGRTDVIKFSPSGDFLRSDKEITEPHSFDVEVLAEHKGKSFRWKYDSYEGRTTFSEEAVRASELGIESAGPATIKNLLPVYGRVTANSEQSVRAVPRFPGLLRDARKQRGERVERGDLLALVENNATLQTYELRSPISGTIIEKYLNNGAFVDEEPVYLVSDLSTVWVEFGIPGLEAARVRPGQTVSVSRDGGASSEVGSISYLSPVGDNATQMTTARAILPNDDGNWRPGLFVSGTIVIEENAVPLAVKAEALQTFRDWDVVFLRVGNTFEIRPLEIGRRDPTWVEVLSGIEPGQEYVTTNSFLVKADVGKSAASHDH